MSTSVNESGVRVVDVRATGDRLVVQLVDGRVLSVPMDWYPRLRHGTRQERNRWQLSASGRGIHWPDLDEDISVEALLAGRRSAESKLSWQRWLAGRKPRKRIVSASKAGSRPSPRVRRSASADRGAIRRG
jgi:hypothetical protein